MLDKVTCKICGEEMRQVTPNHLKWKHQMTLTEYMKKYPNAQTISETLVQELKDKNAMNNPESVEKIKKTKMDLYGTLAVNNEQRVETWRANGHSETLSERMKTDNPAKKPEVRKKISTKVTQSYIDNPELRESRKNTGFSMHRKNGTYRTIMEEKGLWTPKSKKSQKQLYYEAVDAWTKWSYQTFFGLIENANTRSRKFHLDHKISKRFGFDNDIDPAVIGHYENLQILPHSINESKGAKNALDLSDLVWMIEHSHFVLPKKVLLTCGGAAGHMAHPYDSHGLTFNDMKELVARALTGRLDIEEAVTEKTDGQNIQVTWKNGQPGFARGTKTIINPMTPEQLVADFERKYSELAAKNGKEAAASYRNVVEAYRACAEDLTEAMSQIDPARLQQIFKDGRVFANMEIIYPATQNVIAYDKAHLQFHNLVEYDERGQKVETDNTGGKLMQKIIQDANAHMQKTFSFIAPQRIKLGRVADFEDQQAAFFNEIDQLRNRFNLKETDMISDYHRAWWSDVIRSKAQQMGYEIPEDVLTRLVYRWAFFDKSTNINTIKKQIENPEFAMWVSEFDKNEFKSYYKQNMEPFESIFLRLGAVVLRNATNFLAANPDKTVQSIKADLAALIKDLQNSPNPNIIAKLKQELQRIERLGGFDAIVPAEGLVFVFHGHTYKFTGAFAPVNQILGTLKYMR